MGIVVRDASGSIVRDDAGNEHIDLLAGIGVLATGHRHPRVVEAIEQQLARYLHVMVYGEFVQEPQVRLAEKLVRLLPAGLDTVYFTNSGAEAVEGALKLCRRATGRSGLVAFKGGFHGDTLGAMSVGGNPFYRDPFLPLLPGVDFLDFNDTGSLERVDEQTAAVIVEPVQAEAGVIPARKEFLCALAERCRQVGALLIFDEVITGFGRTGTLFAMERYGVVPDVVVLAKALGGGLPLGAFVSRQEVMRHFATNPPLGHVTTFGGHPLSCAAGLASLDVIIAEDLPLRAERMGARLEQGLREALRRTGLRALRRAGLLIGIEMDSPGLVQRLVRECRKERLIVGWTLHDDTVVRLAPPLVIGEAQVDEALARIERAARRATA
ncbi:MAG: aspartate aminotransferase family protein [Candidatus Dadabacteria bacterium]|nr:MAG: aspartate aminotransferase family protein [Candidatus Dadabacteria bacterium]